MKPVIVVLGSGAGPIRMAGGTPFAMDNTVVGDLPKDAAGVLLMGGGDVNPRLYGKTPHKKVYGVNDNRDMAEWLFLDQAEERGLPVMGICRGSQIMTVHAGGTLRQHIGGHYGEHPVDVAVGSLLAKAAGSRRFVVRSLHHQEVLRTGPGWRVSAVAPDGTNEAVESVDGRCLGVQFHPEMHTQHAYARSLFRWLVSESAARAGLPEPTVPEVRTQRRRKSRAAGPPVTLSWFCPFDGIKFDKLEDQQAHLEFLHGAVQ